MCKRKLTIALEWCKRVFENHYNFIPLNLVQGENGIWSLRSSDERNIMLLYVHVTIVVLECKENITNS